MPIDPKNLRELIPEKVIEKVYDDAISPAAKELGSLTAEVVATARRIISPIQLLGDPFERFKNWVRTISSRVPEERQTQAPPEIAGPVIEAMKYVEDSNLLQQLYLNLLTRAIDKERQSEAHPAFAQIIQQLSTDEAKLLVRLKGAGTIKLRARNKNYAPAAKDKTSSFTLPNIVPTFDEMEIPNGILTFPENAKLYLSHLASLNLILVPSVNYDNTTEFLEWNARTTELGTVFLKSCVPNAPQEESK